MKIRWLTFCPAHTVLKEEHVQTALEAARKSIVLLENNGILPLKDGGRYKVFVTGPNADSQGIMGDWTFPQPKENVVTFYKGSEK